MKKEIEFILNNKKGLVGEHKEYIGLNLLIKGVDDMSFELKQVKAYDKMKEQSLCKIANILFDKDYVRVEQFGLYYLEKEFDKYFFIKKRSFLGKIIGFFI